MSNFIFFRAEFFWLKRSRPKKQKQNTRKMAEATAEPLPLHSRLLAANDVVVTTAFADLAKMLARQHVTVPDDSAAADGKARAARHRRRHAPRSPAAYLPAHFVCFCPALEHVV